MDNNKEQLDILETAQHALQLMSVEIERLKSVVGEQKKEVETWRRVIQSDDEFDMAEIAKVINFKGYGRNKLFEFLRDHRILRYNNNPYQSYVTQGYFRITEEIFNDNMGKNRVYLKTVVKQKGLDFIRRKLDEHYTK